MPPKTCQHQFKHKVLTVKSPTCTIAYVERTCTQCSGYWFLPLDETLPWQASLIQVEVVNHEYPIRNAEGTRRRRVRQAG